MKNSKAFRLFLRLSTLMLMLSLLPVCALGESSTGTPETTVEDTYPWALGDYLLPIDFTPGAVPNEKGYSSSKDASGNEVLSYEDSTIRVTISQVPYLKTVVYVADIVITDPSQLRTAAMDQGDFAKKGRAKEEQKGFIRQAGRMNAVIAINGDSSYADEKRKFGIIFRQGVHVDTDYRLDPKGEHRMDLLLIDENGDFHGIHSAQAGDLDDPSVYKGKKIFNIFAFGPILVENGEALTDFQGADTNQKKLGGTWMNMASQEARTRMAIGQVGPLHYKLFTSVGNYNHHTGLTLVELAAFIASQDVQIAYNLDGGDSARMIFNGKQVNPKTGDPRALWDMIYFASAENYTPAE